MVLKLCATFCLIASMAQNIYAEEMRGGESTHKMSQVVVTATRTEVALEDVSAKMEVITAEDIAKIGAINLTDALRKAANIETRGNGIRIRGMDGKAVLVLVNGRRVAYEDRPDRAVDGAINRINVNNIERIEIIRGAASAIYGSEAMSGVINIITKKSKKRSVLVGANTSQAESNSFYSLDLGTMGKWDAVFDARYTNIRSHGSFDSIRKSSSGTRSSYNLDLGYQFNDNNEVRLYGGYFQEDRYGNKINRTQVTDSSEDSYDLALVYNGNTDNHDFSMTATHNFSDSYSETYDYDKNFVDQSTKSEFGSSGIEVRDTWAFNDANLITFGGEFRRVSADSQQVRIRDLANKDPNNGPLYENYGYREYNGLETDSHSFYLQDEIILFDETLFILPAARYDNYEGFDAQVSPKLGVTWKFHENQRVKVSYGLGFRAPSTLELYKNSWFNRDKNQRWFGNPNLEPEETVGYDLTYEAEYSNVSGAITYFNNDIKNLINWSPGPDLVNNFNPVLGPDGEADYYDHDNTKKASVSGVEVDLSLDFLDSFTLTGQYYYLDAIDEDKNVPLSGRAKHTYIATLDYHRDNGFSTTVWAEWVNDMWNTSGKDRYINFNTVNATISKRWGDKYRFYVGVDNVFNNIDTVIDSFISEREWRAGFEMKF